MASCDRRELRDVSAAVLAVTSHLSVREVLQTILATARRLVNARYAALGIPDEKGSFAEFLADGFTDEQWRAIGPVPRQHGVLGFMLCDPAPVRLADIHDHPRFEGWPAAHPEMTAFLGVPIVDGEEILGELFLADKEPATTVPTTGPPGDGSFTRDDEELVQLLAAHAAIAIVNARLYERSRELSIVEERNRIARELHDAVTQKLFSLRLTADAAAALIPMDPVRAATELDTVRRLAAEATAELRSIVVGLRPVDLAGDGLMVALAKQAELFDRVHEARVLFAGESVPRLGAAREETAYRVAQEALHNALRHGEPHEVRVSLRRHDGKVRLEVVDDGRGFDARDRTGSTRRLGLASMRERARAVGGTLEVKSRPGSGTSIALEVPVDD